MECGAARWAASSSEGGAAGPAAPHSFFWVVGEADRLGIHERGLESLRGVAAGTGMPQEKTLLQKSPASVFDGSAPEHHNP